MKAAVYWTLKRWLHNHRVMESAGGEFIKEDYIEFKNIDSVGFPRIKFWKDTNKFIKVEVFEVSDSWVENELDSLEWFFFECYEGNHYNRIKVKTESWEEVSVYEINRDIPDLSDNYFEKEINNKLYFNWK